MADPRAMRIGLCSSTSTSPLAREEDNDDDRHGQGYESDDRRDQELAESHGSHF
jgi:hypothetical protein